ncbi:MAG: GTPase Era [Bacteroidales bacterium]|jgi:GTP-binding protein Era|nr:GTPase Era [Bacteroidales bacterium]
MEIAHKAGFVNIIGNPNVGKSTLMNALVGENLSITCFKAQTTRHRIKGIVNGDNFQIVYSDLPGILTPAYKMQEMMMRFVTESLKDADIILYLIEPKETNYNEQIIEKLNFLEIPVILVINKIDKANEYQLVETKLLWNLLLPKAKTILVSALNHLNIETLLQMIVEELPVSPPYFPDDELTDRPVRFFVSELIREKIMMNYKKEIPYSVEVVIDSFKEEEDMVKIFCTLFVERDSQKGIILGHKGEAIKNLGIQSRTAIEEFLGKHVYLDMSVKVLKDWRNNDLMMNRFGYHG